MNDHDFLRDLTDRADRAIPDLTVHTERVIPRAHRRRRLIRTGQTVGVVAVLAVIAGGAGWAWQDRPVPPAVPSPTISPTPTPTPTTTPDSAPTPTTTPPPVQTEAPPSPTGSVSAELPYWHIRTEWAERDVVNDRWTAWEQDGLAYNHDNPDAAWGIYPVAKQLEFLFATDGLLPEGVDELRESLVAGVGNPSNPDEALVVDRAIMLLRLGGAAPLDLRQDTLDLLLGSPRVTSTPGADITGRSGLVLTAEVDYGTFRLVVDTDTLTVLQVEEPLYIDVVQVLYHETVAAPPFTPPTPEELLGD